MKSYCNYVFAFIIFSSSFASASVRLRRNILFRMSVSKTSYNQSDRHYTRPIPTENFQFMVP